MQRYENVEVIFTSTNNCTQRMETEKSHERTRAHCPTADSRLTTLKRYLIKASHQNICVCDGLRLFVGFTFKTNKILIGR